MTGDLNIFLVTSIGLFILGVEPRGEWAEH